MNVRTTPLLIPAMLCAGFVSATQAQEHPFKVDTGLEYSTGDYGSGTRTKIWSMPVTGSYETGPWRFEVTLPYLRVDGPGDVIPDNGRVGSVKGHRKGSAGAPSTSVRTTESGIGDLVTSASYDLLPGGPEDLKLGLTGKIKFATADENKGLGTGKNDYSFQIDVGRAYTSALTLFASGGYAYLGSSDATPQDNVFFGTLGANYKVDDRFSAGLALNLREATSSFGDAQAALRASVAYRLDTNLTVHGYVQKGFADGSPDRAIGAHVVWNF